MAALDAIRPRTWPSASTTCHCRTISPCDGNWVFIQTDVLRSRLTVNLVYRMEARSVKSGATPPGPEPGILRIDDPISKVVGDLRVVLEDCVHCRELHRVGANTGREHPLCLHQRGA